MIQYRAIGDSPEIRDTLRAAATSGQFPVPEGVSADELISLLGLSELEAWLVERTRDGTFPAGTLFMLGNEPGYTPNHDPRTPAQLVEDARLVRAIFARHNLGHRVALGGVSTPDNSYNRRAYGSTPLEFFEAILEEAARRDVAFDAFVIHPYPFSGMDLPADLPSEVDPADFTRNSIEQIRAFRSIMLRHGQRDKDLIVGETGLPFAIGENPDEVVSVYANEIMTWCLTATDDELGNRRDENRLVQRFTWFLLTVPAEPTPGVTDHPLFVWDHTVLLSPEGELTALGRTFNGVADRLAPQR